MILFVHAMPDEGWQLEALQRSIQRVGQRGKLFVGRESHPDRGLYPILDRVLSFHRAMLAYVGSEPVAILDPDMVLMRPLEPTVTLGRAMGTRHDVLQEQGIAWQMGWAVPQSPGSMQLLDWPVVLSADDARRLAPVWLDFAERAVLDPSLRSLFGWVLDMYAYAAAAAHVGIAHDVSQPLRVVPGMQERFGWPTPWVMHYHHWAYGLDKRTFVPGMRFPMHPTDEVYNALVAALEAY